MTATQLPLVLVADDDPDLLHLLELRLERSGCRVASARNGEEALSVALEQRPSLAVLDLMMPRLDGCEVVRQLRARPETAALPVILLTTQVGPADIQRGLDAGADACLPKPFSSQELQARVQALVA